MSGPGFDYESALWGADCLRPGERSIAGFRLEEALKILPRSGRILEVGCGAGRFLRALAQACPQLQLVGCDVSRAALDRLAQMAPEIETRAVLGDALPAEGGEFDAVLGLDVLEHAAHPDAMLAEMARVLAPAGALHLHVPCEGDALSPWRWLPGQAGPGGLKRRLAGHVQRFRRAELLERVERAGFCIERVRYSLHLLGALLDVAAFLGLAAAELRGGGTRTTGDLVAQSGARSSLGFLVKAADALLWSEARLLSRVPSWCVHVSARLGR